MVPYRQESLANTKLNAPISFWKKQAGVSILGFLGRLIMVLTVPFYAFLLYLFDSVILTNCWHWSGSGIAFANVCFLLLGGTIGAIYVTGKGWSPRKSFFFVSAVLFFWNIMVMFAVLAIAINYLIFGVTWLATGEPVNVLENNMDKIKEQLG